MTVHFIRDITEIKKQIILLCSEVQSRLDDIARAMAEHNKELAREVIKRDIEIDQKEVKIEEDILKVLALHQPVASDLRFLIAVLKINNDIERIADEVSNIASRVVKICSLQFVEKDQKLSELIDKVKTLLKMGISALVQGDSRLAKEILEADDKIDEEVHRQFVKIKKKIKEDSINIEYYFEKARIYRHLERIADHTTNIAEDIIYMEEGKIVRHSDLPEIC